MPLSERLARIKSRLAHPSFNVTAEFNKIIADPGMVIFEKETHARLKRTDVEQD